MKKGKKDEGELLPETWEPPISIGPDKPKKSGKKVTVFIV